jgi:hypothetical protein
MIENWQENIIYSESWEKNELVRWIEIIGERKYYEYFKLVKAELNMNNIPFDALRECAIYDKKISLVLYGIIRDIELEMRHLVLKHLTVDEFKKEYLSNIGNQYNKKQKIKKLFQAGNITLDKFLQEIDITELIKCIKQLSIKNNLFEYSDYLQALKLLGKIRIIIMHQKTLLSLSKSILHSYIVFILQLIIDKEYRIKKMEEVNKTATYGGTEVRLYKVVIEKGEI